MNRTIKSLGILLLMVGTAMAQSNFEGVITMTTTNAEINEKAELTWHLKAESSRMDVRSSADGHTSEYAIISDAKGMDMVSKGHVTPIAAKDMRTTNAAMTLLDEAKGQKANGFDCIKRTYTDGINDVTYWLAAGLKVGFSDLPLFLRRNMPRLEDNLFPVKMEKRDAEGKVLLTQDVLSVSASTVDAAKFDRK